MLHLFFFFFNDTATTEIYTLSLHDALPISFPRGGARRTRRTGRGRRRASSAARWSGSSDRKSTRLNSSHSQISYAVFCLKKKKNTSLYHLHCYTRSQPYLHQLSHLNSCPVV